MALEDYRRKRDFRKTAEPAGGHLRTEDHPMEYLAFAGVIPKGAEAMKAPPVDQALLEGLYTRLQELARKTPPFADAPRNQRTATCIAPYSTRAKPGAPVSVPIAWEELDEGVRSDQFNTSIPPRRLESLKNDPWAEIDTLRQGITAGAKRKIGMRG